MSPTTAFFAGAIALVLLAWLLLLLPANRRSRVDDRQRLNLRLRREQLAVLDLELAAGSLAREEHRQATTEVERATLEEADAQAPALPSAHSTQAGSAVSHRMAATLALGVAGVAFGLYGFLGNVDALDPVAPSQAAAGPNEVKVANDVQVANGAASASAATPASGADASAASVEAMLDSMAASMARQREGTVDAAGWALVARSYATLQRFDRASQAYARALALTPDDAQLLADHSDVLSMLQDRRMAGEPIRLATRALQLDPDNLKALALTGSDAFERGDFAAAQDLWSRARRLSPPGAFADGIDRNLAAVMAAQMRSSTSPPQSAATTAAPPGLQLRGRLRVAPELAGRIAPTDAVFVFAREPGTVGMPIAIARYSAKDLPVEFVLDARNAMVDPARLATLSRVEVGARVSRSGDATPRAGDLRGKSGPVAIDQRDLTLTIDDVTP